MKDFADDNFRFDENGRKLSKPVENTVGKGEIARYEQFLLFPQCFQKACFPGASKGVIMWEWVKFVSYTNALKKVNYEFSLSHSSWLLLVLMYAATCQIPQLAMAPYIGNLQAIVKDIKFDTRGKSKTCLAIYFTTPAFCACQRIILQPDLLSPGGRVSNIQDLRTRGHFF